MKNNNNREEAENREFLYKRFYHDSFSRYVCFYCGEPAGTFDHVPPISRVDDYKSLRLANEIFIKVPSCLQCNRLLSDSLQITIHEREQELKILLKRKLDKYLRIPEWSSDELKEMGPVMKRDIERDLLLKDRAKDRLAYSDGIDFFYREYPI